MMSEEAKQKIIKNAQFLDYKGYIKSIGGNTINYSSDGIDIIITFEPNSEISDVSIKFKKENEIYSVGWIACVRGGLEVNPHQKLENVLILLSYINENYEIISDISYCKESDKLIDDFIANEKKKKL